jgi:hypothetical protein
MQREAEPDWARPGHVRRVCEEGCWEEEAGACQRHALRRHIEDGGKWAYRGSYVHEAPRCRTHLPTASRPAGVRHPRLWVRLPMDRHGRTPLWARRECRNSEGAGIDSSAMLRGVQRQAGAGDGHAGRCCHAGRWVLAYGGCGRVRHWVRQCTAHRHAERPLTQQRVTTSGGTQTRSSAAPRAASRLRRLQGRHVA